MIKINGRQYTRAEFAAATGLTIIGIINGVLVTRGLPNKPKPWPYIPPLFGPALRPTRVTALIWLSFAVTIAWSALCAWLVWWGVSNVNK